MRQAAREFVLEVAEELVVVCLWALAVLVVWFEDAICGAFFEFLGENNESGRQGHPEQPSKPGYR